MHQPDSVLVNVIHKILWDFKIQKDHPILSRRPDLVLINKKKITCHLVEFAVPTDHIMKVEKSEKIDKYLDLARELKKNVKYEGEGDTNCN